MDAVCAQDRAPALRTVPTSVVKPHSLVPGATKSPLHRIVGTISSDKGRRVGAIQQTSKPLSRGQAFW